MNKLILTFFISFLLACQQKDTHSTYAPESLTIKHHAAHWITPNLLVVAGDYASDNLVLLNKNNLTTQYPLVSAPIPLALSKKHPHLSGYSGYRVNIPHEQIKQLLKQPLIVANKTTPISFNKATYVQTANVIDALYTANIADADEITDFGARIVKETKQNITQFKLWAPTALSVQVLVFKEDKSPANSHRLTMSEDRHSGVWHIQTTDDLTGYYYQYQIMLYHPASQKIETLITTDPYSLSLSSNSQYSQVIDLSGADTLPVGWTTQKDNKIEHPEDNIFYETHIRDFSAHDGQLSDPKHKGKYLAFTESNSDSINHLKALKVAGINNIHLLPSFDIGTVNETPNKTIDLNDPVSKACQLTQAEILCDSLLEQSLSIREQLEQLSEHDSSRQKLISAIRHYDNYNWGYDPFHYTVPEGSYALNPDGISRIIEFREMVQSLHNLGFRVIMDVVYNHTHQAGLSPNSVLDKIVPNYYHRLDPLTGEIAQSTCCDNTATERVMMEKLMIDSLVVWARDYKIDGFRFDLMAHQPKAAMLRARKAVQAIDADTYFYGEGWNFGEVANNQRFIQASQLELAGSEIGTFTDRLRDAVRGGAFTAQGADIRRSQGIGNGLATFPNELQQSDLSHYYQKADQLRIGLTGNLANYPLKNYLGNSVLGKEIPYGVQPTGYALDPADTINYVSKHDNQTLWDNNQYRIDFQLSTHDRVRMQVQSLAFAIFAQGIPFIHMGSELLRSKSFLRDSYDYGDWFNKVDFSKQSNNYHIGLPPADKDQQNWSIITEVINKNEGRDKVSPNDIAFSSAAFVDLIKIRMSSPLFRLTTAEEIIKRVQFHNTGVKQKIGLFVMTINGDNNQSNLVVIFNTSANTQSFDLPQYQHYQLHPILKNNNDPRVKDSQESAGVFTVPALTTAIFVNK